MTAISRCCAAALRRRHVFARPDRELRSSQCRFAVRAIPVNDAGSSCAVRGPPRMSRDARLKRKKRWQAPLSVVVLAFVNVFGVVARSSVLQSRDPDLCGGPARRQGNDSFFARQPDFFLAHLDQKPGFCVSTTPVFAQPARRLAWRLGAFWNFRMNEISRKPAELWPNWQAPVSTRALADNDWAPIRAEREFPVLLIECHRRKKNPKFFSH